MKKVILLMAIVALTFQVQAQKVNEKDVPQPTTSSFFKANPTAMDVDWMREGKNYVAKFEDNEVKKFSTYSDEGKLIEHGMSIVPAALPTPVLVYVRNNFKGDEEVKNPCKIINSQGEERYEVEVKGMDHTFDAKGNHVKSVKKS